MFKNFKVANLPLKSLKVDLATLPLAVTGTGSQSQTGNQTERNQEVAAAEKASKTPRPVLHAHYSLVTPSAPPDPVALISLNKRFAKELGFDGGNISDDELAVLCGSKPFPSSSSWAYCYGGHQFGSWAGQLGDGRAISISQIQTSSTASSSRSNLYELQLKGAGMTPYSRFADGLAVVRSSIREYLCAEAMHALGVPTSRSLSLVTTGRVVEREIQEKGAIVCRVSPCWIRFGNFEIFYARDDVDNLRVLADYVIETFYPSELVRGQYTAFLEKVVQNTATMIAKWQTVGFCHGVMNTDNFSILGETIDYGPFQFLDAYDSTYICNHSDEMGRYSFMEQPNAALFNLIRLATALSPLLEKELEGSPSLSLTETIKPILDQFAVTLRTVYQGEICRKFGFSNLSLQDTRHLMESVVQPLLMLLREAEMDYTLFMRTLSSVDLEKSEVLSENVWQSWIKCSYRSSTLAKNDAEDAEGQELKIQFLNWFTLFRQAHLSIAGGIKNDHERRVFMEGVNPRYILRNNVVQKVIEAVEEQVQGEGGGTAGTVLVEKYLHVLQNPFVELENVDDDKFFGGMVPSSQRNIKCSCSS